MSHSNVQIHEAVRSRYTNVIQQSSSCCGSGESSACCDTYDNTLLDALPDDITELSLGCGDPVTIAALNPGETVLDLGSGAGMDCFLAAQQVGTQGLVIGVDMTPAMLAKANVNKARLGVSNVEFRQGQIEALPVDADSVDIIMSNCVINLSPQKDRVFAEAFRVLKPGGRIAISDIVTDGSFSPDLQADMSQWSECVTGALPAAEYIALIEQVGFADIQVVDKVNAEGIVTRREGMPNIFSARITATKPSKQTRFVGHDVIL